MIVSGFTTLHSQKTWLDKIMTTLWVYFFLINNQFGKKICINDKVQTFTFKTDDVSPGSVAELIGIL